MFLGKSEDALSYFELMGYRIPPLRNPADFFMEVIAGKHARTVEIDSSVKDECRVIELWKQNRQRYLDGSLIPRNDTISTRVSFRVFVFVWFHLFDLTSPLNKPLPHPTLTFVY